MIILVNNGNVVCTGNFRIASTSEMCATFWEINYFKVVSLQQHPRIRIIINSKISEKNIGYNKEVLKYWNFLAASRTKINTRFKHALTFTRSRGTVENRDRRLRFSTAPDRLGKY